MLTEKLGDFHNNLVNIYIKLDEPLRQKQEFFQGKKRIRRVRNITIND